MIVAHDLIVAVLDGGRLRLFRNKAAEPHVDLVELPAAHLEPVNTGSGGRHRSSTANPDASRLDEDDFAAAVAAHLNHEVLAGRIERLFVIADPRTLGEVRRHLHKETSARLAGDLAKNLAGHGADDIAAALLAA